MKKRVFFNTAFSIIQLKKISETDALVEIVRSVPQDIAGLSVVTR